MAWAGSSDLSRGQSHLVSQPFKLPGCPSLSMLAIQFRKVVRSFFLIGLTSREHVIVNHQNAVCHRSTFVATASSNLMILRREVTVLGSRCGIGSLNQHCF